jgi:hypothetical protein
LADSEMGIIVGVGPGGKRPVKAVHQALLIVPADVVGGDQLPVGKFA